MEELLYPVIGDNWQSQESDWILNGNDEDVLNVVSILPNAPLYKFKLNQYAEKDWYTSCTKFSSMNGLWNDMGYTPTREDVLRIEEKSRLAGWGGPGYGRVRGGGVDVVRKDWNENNPNDEVATALTSIFSRLFRLYLNQGRGVIVSIRPDSDFRRDVILDGRLDNADFGIGGGHATCIRKIDGVFRFVDSVGSSKGTMFDGREYTFTEDQLKSMINNGTFSSDCHIFIPKHIIKMIAKDVPEGQWYSESADIMIKNGIMVGNEGKYRPNDTITRAEVGKAFTNLLKKLNLLNEDGTIK